MGSQEAAKHSALVEAITEAHRELKATWAEARRDARHLGTAKETEELEAAITSFLRSHRKLIGAGERLKDRLARFRKARKRPGPGGG